MARRLPEFLTEEELTALLRQPNPRYRTGARNRALMRLMCEAGLRVSEALNLRWQDVNLISGSIMVLQGKGKKDRRLWLNESGLEVLRAWRDKAPESDYIMTTLEGGRLNPRYVRAMVKRYARKAGVPKDVHPHMLRHTFATHLLRDTKNLRLVQKALGHSRIDTTEIYTHIVDEELEEAMRSFRIAP